MRVAGLRCGCGALRRCCAVLIGHLGLVAVGAEQGREQFKQLVDLAHGEVDPCDLGLGRLALAQQLLALTLKP